MVVVTFRLRASGEGDPVGDLPPHYDRYAMVDRHYRGRVQPGETWLCRVYTHHLSFLIPLHRLELPFLLSLDPTWMDSLAKALVHQDVPLGHRLEEHLAAIRRDQEAAASYQRERLEALSFRLNEIQRDRDDWRHRYEAAARGDASFKTESPWKTSVARCASNGWLESPDLRHVAYTASFTADFRRLLLRPDVEGQLARNGLVRVPGLEVARPGLAPCEMEMEWSDGLDGFLIELPATTTAAPEGDALPPVASMR